MIDIGTMSKMDKDDFKRIISELFLRNSIMRSKINPRTGVTSTNELYGACFRMEPKIREYLELCGIELIHDSNFDIYYVKTSEDDTPISRERTVRKETTYILFALKHLFDEQQITMEDRYVKINEITEWCDQKGLITKNLNSGIDEIFSYLKKKNIVVYNGNRINREETRIYITPVITTVITPERNQRYLEQLEAIENSLESNTEGDTATGIENDDIVGDIEGDAANVINEEGVPDEQ